jgi:hypothetical protein
MGPSLHRFPALAQAAALLIGPLAAELSATGAILAMAIRMGGFISAGTAAHHQPQRNINIPRKHNHFMSCTKSQRPSSAH